MVGVVVIMVGVILCVYMLATADIHITLTHEYVKQEPVKQETAVDIVQKQLDDAASKDDNPSFDDIIKAVQNIVGGDYDEQD